MSRFTKLFRVAAAATLGAGLAPTARAQMPAAPDSPPAVAPTPPAETAAKSDSGTGAATLVADFQLTGGGSRQCLPSTSCQQYPGCANPYFPPNCAPYYPTYPGMPTPSPTPSPTPTPETPTPETPTPTPAPTPEAAAPSFASQSGGAGLSNSLALTVFGDLIGPGVVAGPSSQVVVPSAIRHVDEALLGPSSRTSTVQSSFVAVPQAVYGAFKITENETPRPTTRIYSTYNFYDQVLRGFGGSSTAGRLMLHQEVIGYEQAFFDRRASVGIRLPYNQFVSNNFNSTSLGDLTLISKAVIWDNARTGSLLSGGLALTVPSGSSLLTNSAFSNRAINTTLFQPYLGYIIAAGGNFFVQGFSSIIVPANSQEVTLLTNDFAAGYWLYRAPGAFLSAVVPVLEGHLNNPLSHRGFRPDGPWFVDNFNMLAGTHMFFYDRSSLGFGVGTPLTGPRPFSLQTTVQMNFRF